MEIVKAVSFGKHTKKFKLHSEEIYKRTFNISPSTKIILKYFDKEVSTYIDCDVESINNGEIESKLIKIEIDDDDDDDDPLSCPETSSHWTSYLVHDSRSPSFERPTSTPSTPSFTSGIIKVESQSLQKCDTSFESRNLDISTAFSLSKDLIDSSPKTPLQNESSFPREESYSKKFRPGDRDASPNSMSELEIECHEIKPEPAPEVPLQRSQPMTLPEVSCNAPYELPKHLFPEPLLRALSREKPLRKGLKSMLLETIYRDFTSKNKYYIGKYGMYEKVASCIIDEYPYLRSGMSMECAMLLWKKSLYQRFSNGRRHEDSVALLPTQKYKRGRKGSEVKISSANWWKIPNYAPAVGDVNEDDITNHKTMMKNEMEKWNQNHKLIQTSMDATYAVRRKLLLTTRVGAVEKVMTAYPALGSELQLKSEMERIMLKDLTEDYVRNLPAFDIQLDILLLKTRSKNKKLIDQLFKPSDDSLNSALMLGKIVVLLREDPLHVIGTDRVCRKNVPKLVFESESVALYVNGVCIAHISSFFALFYWLASFLIFNIEVPKEVSRTFHTLEVIVFQLKESKKVSLLAHPVLFAFEECSKQK